MNSKVSTAAGLSKTTWDLLAASNMRPPAECSSDILYEWDLRTGQLEYYGHRQGPVPDIAGGPVADAWIAQLDEADRERVLELADSLAEIRRLRQQRLAPHCHDDIGQALAGFLAAHLQRIAALGLHIVGLDCGVLLEPLEQFGNQQDEGGLGFCTGIDGVRDPGDFGRRHVAGDPRPDACRNVPVDSAAEVVIDRRVDQDGLKGLKECIQRWRNAGMLFGRAAGVCPGQRIFCGADAG
jgi:hypothetical protein